MLIYKAIKPEKLKTDAMLKEIIKGAEEAGKILLDAHQRVTTTWDPPPKFEIRPTNITMKSKRIIVGVGTDDMRWKWTDEGTKPHIIRPKNAKRLMFPTNFSPKSRPGRLQAYAGSSGPPMAVAMEVHHPGTKARNFTDQIRQKRAPQVRGALLRGMQRAVKASGHEID